MVSRSGALGCTGQRFRAFLALSALVLSLFATGAARAAPPDSDSGGGDVPALARQRYQEATIAYQQGRYKDAIDLFKEADKLAPSAALSFNMARAAEKIGDTAAALAAYRDYLRRAPEATDRAQVETIVRRLSKQLQKKGVQQVTVMSAPPGATLVIDEQPVGVTPWTGELAPGAHQLVLRLPGHGDVARSLELAAEQPQDVTAELTPLPPTDPAAPRLAALPETWAEGAGPGAPGAERATSPRVGALTWVTLGAGAAVMIGAGVFELGRRSAVEAAREETTQIGRGEQLETAESRMDTARVLAGVGGALLVLGGILVVIDLAPSADVEQSQLGVRCGASSCSVVGSTRF